MSGLESGQRIIEGVMTSISSDGIINIAPMGPIVDDAMTTFILRPFKTSTTYQNLKATGESVFHVTDDVLLIARGAIGKVEPNDEESCSAIDDAPNVNGVVLTNACRYFELKVKSIDDSSDRTHIVAEGINQQTLRDHFGFNRAQHAVLEAAILATRLHLTGKGPVLAEFDRLQTPINKTGGQREHQAMDELRAFVSHHG